MFYRDICWINLNKTVILLYFPYKSLGRKLRFEVLFKKFHPKINMTTLFLTKIYLLNTKMAFCGDENWYLGPKQQNLDKPLLGGYPWEPKFQNSEYEMHWIGFKDHRSLNFRTLAFKGEVVGVTQIYPTTAANGAWQTDFFFAQIMLFSHKKFWNVGNQQ
jgi:hypothetical protein